MTWVAGSSPAYLIVLGFALALLLVVVWRVESRPEPDPEREAIDALRAIWERNR